jgi:hypothetical protein
MIAIARRLLPLDALFYIFEGLLDYPLGARPSNQQFLHL